MVTVAIYIYIDGVAKRVELFNDEKISITSAVQDVADISKVFTDYSQSFTVPASKVNNQIFGHWYENSIDGGFDARIRKDAYIELDTIRFRKGKIQLEKASLKNGQIDNYTITFYGSLISLKDAFNNRNLKDFNFDAYQIPYTFSAILSAINAPTTADLKFPLISSGNVWQYNTGGSSPTNWDIKNYLTPMYTDELYPALRVSKIFEAIQNELNITFEGDFLNNERFKRLFLLLKNGDALFPLKNAIAPTKINFNTKSAIPNSIAYKFDLTKDTLNFDGKVLTPNGNVDGYLFETSIELTFYTNNIPYKFIVYKNGAKFLELNLKTSVLGYIVNIPLTDIGAYTFYVSCEQSISYDAYFNLISTGIDPVTGLSINNLISAQNTTVLSTQNNINISESMPDIKVEDFFSGILKMFNLTCYSEKAGVFRIEQIEAWYTQGNIIDISQYVLSEQLDVERVSTYKIINFNYEKSENLISNSYRSNATHEYGDLEYKLDIDGGDYAIKLPFENILFQKFTGTNLQVGYSLKSDYKPYKPKPVILYDYNIKQSCDFYLADRQAGLSNVTDYNMFGQETNISGINYSINWGIEQSSFTDQFNSNTLFANYYNTYISNIFNAKSRKIKVKAIMPISLLTKLKLNDRLVIRDKRYIINSFTTDLTTGVVDLDLLTDFRTI